MITRLVLLTCLLSFAATASPASAEDEPYTARVSTRTEVDVRQVMESGTSFVAEVRVEANSPLQPTGSITVTVTRLTEERAGRTVVSRSGVERSSSARGEQVWTTSVAYTGGEVTTQGPTLREVGRYQVTARFEPDVRSVFRGSQGGAMIRVVAATDGDGDNTDGGGNGGDSPTIGGFLPDTGGPDFWLLLLGLGLVGSGGTLVVVARRRRPDPSFG